MPHWDIKMKKHKNFTKLKTDLEILQECLMDKTYKNKVQLELILDRIEDHRLANGFLITLYTKSDKYECNIDDILESMFHIHNGKKPTIKDLTDDGEYFRLRMNDYIKSRTDVYQLVADLLRTLCDGIDDLNLGPNDHLPVNNKFRDKVSTMSKEELVGVKGYFISEELYEYLPCINEYL